MSIHLKPGFCEFVADSNQMSLGRAIIWLFITLKLNDMLHLLIAFVLLSSENRINLVCYEPKIHLGSDVIALQPYKGMSCNL